MDGWMTMYVMQLRCCPLLLGDRAGWVSKAELVELISLVESIKLVVQPTVWPTVRPTVQSTVRPTVWPTVRPTVRPTVQPTVRPTVWPTVQPTVRPTVRPTVQPTVRIYLENKAQFCYIFFVSLLSFYTISNKVP
uniref:Uncharacterized protein n=1 Tax=Sphaeramia orbicularis TaxID=375764 RepID=A0A673BGI2_9TELE